MQKLNRFTILPRLGKIIVASALMGCLAFGLFLLGTNVVVNVVVCIGAYFVMLKLLKEPVLDELTKILKPFRDAEEAIAA